MDTHGVVFIPLSFSFHKKHVSPITCDWINEIGCNLINNVHIEVGGGTGYWCTKCGKLYKKKPCDNYICHNTLSVKTLNKEKLSQVIAGLGEIDDVSVRQYVEENITSPAIEKIFSDERQHQTEEEESYSIIYNDLMELIEERYGDDIYDDIITNCGNNVFICETRTGHVTDEQSGEYLDVWEKLK